MSLADTVPASSLGPQDEAPFPPADPPGAKPDPSVVAAAELASAANLEEVETRVGVHYETLVNAIGTVRSGLAEIVALSSSPSVNTERLGKLAKALLDGLPVT